MKWILASTAIVVAATASYYYYKTLSSPQPSSEPVLQSKKSSKKKKKKSSKSAEATTSTSELNQSPTHETLVQEETFPSDQEIENMSSELRSQRAQEAKKLGNQFFTTQGYQKAIEMYSQAIKFSPEAVYYSNRAACYSLLKDYDKVISDCDAALKLDSKYVKALTRRAHALENLGKYSAAMNGTFIVLPQFFIDFTAVCVLEEFKNETTLATTDRLLKRIASDMTEEIMKTKEILLPSETFIRGLFLDLYS